MKNFCPFSILSIEIYREPRTSCSRNQLPFGQSVFGSTVPFTFIGRKRTGDIKSSR